MRSKITRTVLALVALIVVVPQALPAANSITPAQAGDHVGETRTVCGHVAGTHYAESTRGGPTFLNLDEPYPRHIFTVVIWRRDRGKFRQAPERFYDGLRICVTGKIGSHEGIPQIIVRDPSQIEIVKEGSD